MQLVGNRSYYKFIFHWAAIESYFSCYFNYYFYIFEYQDNTPMSQLNMPNKGNMLPQEIEKILTLSYDEAVRLGNDMITREHIFLAILQSEDLQCIGMLTRLGADLVQIKAEIENNIRVDSQQIEKSQVMINRSVERLLKLIYLEAKDLKDDELKPYHLILAILRDESSFVSSCLIKNGINYEQLKDELMKRESDLGNPQFLDSNNFDDDDDDTQSYDKPQISNVLSHANSKTGTPVLDNFGIDITKQALEGKLDPIVGREKEIIRIAQILSRRKKNNPILIGEPGVGKSAIAEGLALRIIEKKVPRSLLNKRLMSLDIASIVAGTKYRGQFEERIKAIIGELSRVDDVILFIDEIHTIVGAGGAIGSLDAANMLKPALARGAVQCIGATTLSEYSKHIESDGALERRFQRVTIEPTTEEETIKILNNIKSKYEEHHRVHYTDAAIEACVKLTSRYVSDRTFPDKAIDALDEAGSQANLSQVDVPKSIVNLEKEIAELVELKNQAVKNQAYEKAASYRDKEKNLQITLNQAREQWEKSLEQHRTIVDEIQVAEVVSLMTGIPTQRLQQSEMKRLIDMHDELKGAVVGQDEAIAHVVRAIQRNRSGLKDPNKPIGSFIFLGPTGVGKTQLAKVLSKYLFNGIDSLIRVDMSEYMEKFAVSRLVGAPPGYVGYDKGGQLTEKVRRKPYSVILLDEIEKAHPDVFNILLQLLDEGRLTDSLGRVVDFKNTLIIMTSNIGSRQLQDFGHGVGFSTIKTEAQANELSHQVITKSLKKTFSPEFLNRIDDVVMFNKLSKEHLVDILDIELKSLHERIENLGYKLKISKSAKEYVAESGYDNNYGARPLQRAIQRNFEDAIASVIIKNEIAVGDSISIGFDSKKKELKLKILKVEDCKL
ncbi:MAG: ATP-dependent Clp protease ATP-binding subunit [Mangrovibacterium sp.]